MRTRTTWLGIVGALVVAGCGAAGGDADGLARFRASLVPTQGGYVFEGDLFVPEDRVEEFYRAEVAAADGVGTARQAAILAQYNGHDDINTSGLQYNLTYCVARITFTTPGFSQAMHDMVVAAINTAAAQWEQTANVNFIHVPSEDTNCTSANTNVWFNIRPSPVASPDYAILAFFPHSSRADREILVAAEGTSSATWLHELGHVLGFRHEHIRPEAPGACEPTATWRPLTPYDNRSVMHYHSGECAGPASTYSITRLDRLAAQRIYGPPDTQCFASSQEICTARGAFCTVIHPNSGGRFDLCVWPTAMSPSACSSTSGIWTTATQAASWPGAVPAGQAGACITQVYNLACSLADQDRCLLRGGTCERAYSITGSRHDLCRWPSSAYGSSFLCEPTAGIWTTAGDGFATTWPTAVPAGHSGACITQMGNL
jgi:serralysin